MTVCRVRASTRVRLPFQRLRALEPAELNAMIRRLARAGDLPRLCEARIALELHRLEQIEKDSKS